MSMNRISRVATALLIAGGLGAGVVRAQEALVWNESQTAVLDPANWDTVFAGERYFDALRPLLIRFPGLAEPIHAKLAEGFRVDKLELALTWERQEGPQPQRGRHGWGANELYKNMPGEWSVDLQPLLRPWGVGNLDLGPTFNANLRGASYWSRGGARGDGEDRLATRLGPLPLHPKAQSALFDLTSLLDDPAYGKTFGDRLRALEACGVQLYKHELFDMRYRSFYAYDWSVSTGYMRIWVKPPEIRVHFAKADGAAPSLPPAIDIVALAQQAAAAGGRGQPSLRMPEDHAAQVKRLLARPKGIPDWQWARIQELRALHAEPADSQLYLGRGVNFSAFFSDDEKTYFTAVQHLMEMAPRTWQGHLTSDFALLAAGYNTLLSPAAQDHLALYWQAWLQPDVEQPFDEFLGGGTQRGGPTYFRGYTRSMGTMNFVHNANMGALLGGQYLKSEVVVANARHGIEHVLLRAYAFGNGAHQEIGDTYYQALTIGGAGALAKYAAHPFDRLMGTIIRDRLVEPLISMYHPGLRRMTHPMGRGSFTYHLLLQEGSYNVLHSLSPSGALIHLDDLTPERKGTLQGWGSIHGLAILGNEGPPERIGLLAPWTAPVLADAVAGVVDRKTFPWQVFARDSSPGCRRGGWHVNHLGRNFALASRDNANHDYGVTSIIAQWRRRPQQVASLDDLSTLLVSLGSNEHFTREIASMAEFGIVQAGGKLIALKALPDAQRNVFSNEKGGVKALHVSALLLAHGDVSQREVWINEQRADALSGAQPDPGGDWRKRMGGDPVVFAADGDLITIADGATYTALIPISLNALARDQQVSIAYNHPALMINVHLYRADQSIDTNALYHSAQPPTAGFIMELADADDYPSFAAFRAHMAATTHELRWDKQEGLAQLTYRSGADTLEMGFDPRRYPAVMRRINGAWPYLPAGVERASEWAVQSRTGRIEKHDAVLETEPGREAYLQAFPDEGLFVAYNPLPDPTLWRLTLPGGRCLTADGRLGLARVIVRSGDRRLWIEHAAKPGVAVYPDSATALLAFGWSRAPQVELNGKPLARSPRRVTLDGEHAYVIPLDGGADAVDTDLLAARYGRFKDRVTAIRGTHLVDWQVVGPFPADFDQAHGPEKALDFTAAYSGIDGQEVRWQRVGADVLNSRNGIDLDTVFSPNSLALAYAATRLEADTDRDVTLFFGSPANAAIWVNGRQVYQRQRYYRVFFPDQDRLTIPLRKGVNEILLKIGRTYESWAFSFRLADEHGLPLPEGSVTVVR